MKSYSQSSINRIHGSGMIPQTLADRHRESRGAKHEAYHHLKTSGKKYYQTIADREAESLGSLGSGMRPQTLADRHRESRGSRHKAYHHLKTPGHKYAQTIADRDAESHGSLGSGLRQTKSDRLRESRGARHLPYHHLIKPGRKYAQSAHSRKHESEEMMGDGKSGGFAFLPFLPLLASLAAPLIGMALRPLTSVIQKKISGKGSMFAPGAASGRHRQTIKDRLHEAEPDEWEDDEEDVLPTGSKYHQSAMARLHEAEPRGRKKKVHW